MYTIGNKEECVMKSTVFDVAKYILHKMGEISTWKLQKLCFYSQAWELAWTGTPMFDEDFQAWTNGPVCPELFHAHQGKFSVTEEDIIGNINNLSDEQKESIDVVLRDYGNMEPYELRAQTHAENPWINARNGCKEGEPCSNVITKESMGEYYGGL